jgi:hypothetical protein
LVNIISNSSVSDVVKITGKITAHQCARKSASFVFTENDQNKMGVIAIAAALAGLGGQAVAVASNATCVEEEADYVQFKLNGILVQGWVWRSPFAEGDDVQVAAQWLGDHYEAFGIARPSDKVIALYPHCSRAKMCHIYNAIKWWLIMVVGVCLLVVGHPFVDAGFQGGLAYWSQFFQEGLGWIFALIFVFFGVAIASMAMKWMPFVSLAGKIFKTLELPHPGSIDLVNSSKRQRTAQDKDEFGVMYFKY